MLSYVGFTGMTRYPCSCMYFAAKWLGRCHWAERPTTAMVREVLRMRRSFSLSSMVRRDKLDLEMDSNRFAAFVLTAWLALPAAAYNHVETVTPRVQGPFNVACSNVAQDGSRIAPGLTASDYW